MATAPYPWRREQTVVLAVLLLLAGTAWILLIWQSTTSQERMMGLTMGMSAPVFLGVWVVMMIAMMFPAAAPMITMFSRVHEGKRARGQPFVPTVVFVAPYLVVWTAFGALGYAAAVAYTPVEQQTAWLMGHAARIAGSLFLLTGLYQLTPLKDVCLSKCRTPLAFLLNSWRDGYGGAFRMGLDHALYCLGCCWLLFVLLFPIGIMNVAAMAAISVFIVVEKALPRGVLVGRIVALLFIAYGALLIAIPEAWPMTWSGTAM